MSLVGKLIGFGLRQVIGTVAGDAAGQTAGEAAGSVIQLVERHFTDHSQTLPKALARANERAWQALSIALAGDTLLDQIKRFFLASGDDKGIREQVRLFLQDKNIGYEGMPVDFRKRCLTELTQAKKAGLLTFQNPSSKEVARQTANFQRYADPKGVVDGAEQVMAQIADDFPAEFPNLRNLMRQRPAGGPPLLASAFAYFFRREVETDDELAHGLFFDGLRQLSAAQEKAFEDVGKALTSLGDQFEQVFQQVIQQLERIETVVVETQTVAVETKAVAVATHDVVLKIEFDIKRLGNSVADEVVLKLLETLNVAQRTEAGKRQGGAEGTQVEQERQRREQEEAEREAERKQEEQEEKERQQQGLARLQQEGETRLTDFLQGVFSRTQGILTTDDHAAFNELRKRYRISWIRAKRIVRDFREQWQKVHLLGKEYLVRALKLMDENEYDRAISDCNEAIRQDPKPFAYITRAVAYWYKGDFDRVISDCNKAIGLDHKFAIAYVTRAGAYRRQNDFDSAISDATEAIRLDPNIIVAYATRAEAYRMKDDYHRAIADATEAIRLNPEDAWAYATRAEAYRMKDDYHRAISDATEAIRLDPNDAQAYRIRGNACRQKGDFGTAIADFTEALRLNPNDEWCKNQLEMAKRKQR